MRSPKKLCRMQASVAILSARIAELSAAINTERRQAAPNLEALKTLYAQRIALLVRRADINMSQATQSAVGHNTQSS